MKHKRYTQSAQPPISCIREEEGYQNVITTYFSKYTAICDNCKEELAVKFESSPFSPALCPCCHFPNGGQPFSFCQECVHGLEEDGYMESGWGSWHLDKNLGEIICIHLDFS